MLVYTVSGNRFLRGMVRGLVATMLKLGRDVITKEEFENIINAPQYTINDPIYTSNYEIPYDYGSIMHYSPCKYKIFCLYRMF